MKLVANWKEAYKWISVHCMALSAAFLGAWALLPDDLKPLLLNSLPPKTLATGVFVVLLIGIVGRFLDQSPSSAPPPEAKL